jgi:outer membrane protein, multidrug efflux system
LTWAQRDQAELSFKQTIQFALADVSNGLVGYTQSRKFRMKIEEQTATYSETARLANVASAAGTQVFLRCL